MASAAPAAAAAAPKGSPAPAVNEKEPTEAELAKENAELEAKIAALKDKLGITAAEEKEELARIRGVFNMFDRDGNGHIDKDEFELLAFECGADLAAISPESLAKTFAAINTKGDGKLTFDDFFKWLKAGGNLKGGAKGANFGSLGLKLQSKVWLKRMENIKDDRKKKEAAGKDAKAAPAAGKDAKAEAPKPNNASNVSVTLGKFGEAKSGIYVTTGDDAAAAQTKRDETNCPEGVPTILHVDFPLKENFDEGQIGELSGIIDMLVSAIPWGAVPLPLYHSHTIDVVDGEAGAGKALRITLFSQLDMQDLAAGLMGQQGGQPLKDVGKGSFKFEVPFSLTDLKDPAFRLSSENIAFRSIGSGDIDRNVLAQSEGALAQMAPLRAWIQSMRIASAQFLKNFDLTLNFASFDELVRNVPDYDPNAAPAPALPGPGGAPVGAGAVARRPRHPVPRGPPPPTPLQAMKLGLQQLDQTPIGAFVDQGLSQLPQLAAATGQDALYEAVRNNIVGLGRVHLQAHDYIFKLTFKGLDFGQLMLPING